MHQLIAGRGPQKRPESRGEVMGPIDERKRELLSSFLANRAPETSPLTTICSMDIRQY